MSEEEFDVYTKKLHEQDMVSMIGALKSTFWKLSGDSLTSSVKERHHVGIKASKPIPEWCLNQKNQSKENTWTTKQPMKTVFLKNHYLCGKLFIILS